MLTKNITYTDYNGTERTETFYFNLNEAELAEMELTTEGGLREWLEKITKSVDKVEIMKTFKKILMAAYGEKSADGRRLDKSPEISRNFTHTEAYNKLFLELIASGDKGMAEFINSIVPPNFATKDITTVINA